jgi:hypothetical protein
VLTSSGKACVIDFRNIVSFLCWFWIGNRVKIEKVKIIDQVFIILDQFQQRCGLTYWTGRYRTLWVWAPFSHMIFSLTAPPLGHCISERGWTVQKWVKI